jgi:hypothetical protein
LLKLLKILTAVAPVTVFLFAVLNSRIRLYQQFGEWILPSVWMVDLTIWLLAPVVYLLPSFKKDSWRANLKLVYWIAFIVLSFLYGTGFAFIAWEVFVE